MLYDLSRALLFVGKTGEAAVHIKRAFAYYVQAEDVTSAAAVVEHPHDVGLLPLLTDELAGAIDLLPEGSPAVGTPAMLIRAFDRVEI